MALRLGDILQQEGLITPGQLEEALKYQVIFGGKLGTNLIEMGVLEEDDITRALAKKFGVAAATSGDFMDIPQATLEAVPRDVVEKHGVIPVKLEGRRLTVVMADPTDYKLIEELSFRSGFIIKTMIAAEVRIVLALEKLYQIERDRRYVHVTKKVVPKRKPAADAVKPTPTPAPSAPPPVAATPAPPVATPATVAPAPVPAPEPELIEIELEEEVEELIELEEICDNETVSLYLAEARDRDDVLDSLAAYLSHEFPRSALFLVRGDIAHGWKASIDHQPLANFSQAQIPLDEPSVLKTVAETRAFFLGPIPRAPFNSMLLQEIGGRVPQTALLVPLLMMGRVVGIIYVDGQGEELSERLFELQKLTAKAAMAFEILVLKNKILSM